MKSIVFYFPYKTIGGVSILFMRLAKQLALFYHVFIMDFNDGYMSRHLPVGCKFIPYDRPELIPSDSLVVFQSVPPWRIENLKNFPISARLLFWNLHPNNLNPMLFQQGSCLESLWGFAAFNRLLSLGRKRKLARTCKWLSDLCSLVFMDVENHFRTELGLGIELPKRLLPILTEDHCKRLTKRVAPAIGDPLHVAWIGRLEDFKIPILIHTLTRLDALTSLKINFDIIGDGAQRPLVDSCVRQLKNLTVRFRGYVNHDVLDQELHSQHVVFAMGTAALDSASLGIPTFCLDFSYRHIEGLYRYRLLRDVHGYNVGEQITDAHLEPISSLEASLSSVLANYDQESNNVLAYWEANHSPQAVQHRFVDLALQASATFDDLVRTGMHRPDLVTALVCACDPRKRSSNGFVLR